MLADAITEPLTEDRTGITINANKAKNDTLSKDGDPQKPYRNGWHILILTIHGHTLPGVWPLKIREKFETATA